MARMIFNCSHHADDPERAILPFIAANVAAASGKQATVVLTIDAVRTATQGGAEGIAKEGFPPLAELVASLVDAGGEIWACSACTKPRGITEASLVKGATIVGAATIVEEIANGAQAVSFA